MTDQGAQAVRAWLTDLAPSIAKATPDPIRTRVSFLEQLASDAERIAFLRRAEALTKEALEELTVTVEALRHTQTQEYLAGLGAMSEVGARLSWLRDVLLFYGGAAAST